MTQDPTARPDQTTGQTPDPTTPPAGWPETPAPAGPPADPASAGPWTASSGAPAPAPEAQPSWAPLGQPPVSSPTGWTSPSPAQPAPGGPTPEAGWTAPGGPPSWPASGPTAGDQAGPAGWQSGPPAAGAGAETAPAGPDAAGWPPAPVNAPPPGWSPDPNVGTQPGWSTAPTNASAPSPAWSPDPASAPQPGWPPDPNAGAQPAWSPDPNSGAQPGWPPAPAGSDAAWPPAQPGPSNWGAQPAGWPPQAPSGPDGAPTSWQSQANQPAAGPDAQPQSWPHGDPNAPQPAWSANAAPAQPAGWPPQAPGGPDGAPAGWPPQAPAGSEPTSPQAKPALKRPLKVAALATAAVVVLAGAGLGVSALVGVGPFAGPPGGPELPAMEQAYIDAAVHLDSAARRHLEYAQDVDALVMTNSDSAGLDRAGQAVKEVLAGQTAFLWLMVADSEMLAALDQIETASLQLAVTDGPLPELARTFAQANVTDLMMNQLLPPAEAGATFDTVTHLSFFNPTLRGLEVAATQFPNLESLSVGCQSDRVDYWRATTLEQATELTSLSVGTSSVHPWYDPAWTPDQTPVDAESLALWLIDHPYTIETFNGSALASFVPTESLDEIADYRSWSLQQVAGQIADQTPSYQASPDGVGLDRGLVVKLDSPPSGWSSSYDAGGAGADYSGLPADRLAHVPEDIRFLAVVQVRAGGREGVYRNSSGVETGLALFGLTSVQVFDVVNQIAHPAADTASTPAPDSVRGGGDHHGPMEPQSAIDRLIGSLI